MHAVIEPIPLPGCTRVVCQTKCLEYANKNDKLLHLFYCATVNCCMCSLDNKKRPPLTTEVKKGLADAEDDNGSFV